VFFLWKLVHYAVKVKWKEAKMKQTGYKNKEMMDELEIRNKSQKRSRGKVSSEFGTYIFYNGKGHLF
jgi:hypothetical protein